MFEADPDTDAVIMVGEIGGSQETEAADYIRTRMTKPVAAYVAGLSAPEGKRMGHTGAIISAFGESAPEKVEILQGAGGGGAPNPRPSSARRWRSCWADAVKRLSRCRCRRQRKGWMSPERASPT